jgi:hypothetical protein
MILTGESVYIVVSVVEDAKGLAACILSGLETGREISLGLNDDLEQSQLERIPTPAIARVTLLPGLLTMIVFPTMLQRIS